MIAMRMHLQDNSDMISSWTQPVKKHQILPETPMMHEHHSLSNKFNLVDKTPYVGLNPGGLPLEILQCDFWVPLASTRAESPQFKGKDVFKEILSTSEATATLYAERVTQAWCSEPFMVDNSKL